ncbi:MAG: MBL fold metallo-hydrolase [Anaerolineales bacterium]
MITLTWITNDDAAPPLRAEHGLAFWIETPDGQILFDTGGSGAVLTHNLDSLDLRPENLNAVVLSHGHDDHTGGLGGILPQLPAETPLYAHPTLFRKRYSRHEGVLESRTIPLSQAEVASRMDLRLDAAPREVLPGIWTSGAITRRPHPEGSSAHHFIKSPEGKEEYKSDPYEDDFSLIIACEDGLFLLCGCCHAGLLNTIEHVQRRWDEPLIGIAGGMHLGSASPDTIRQTVTVLKAMGALRHLWPGHCSGDAFQRALAQAFGPPIYRPGQSGEKLTLT